MLVSLLLNCLAQLSFAQGYEIPEGVGTIAVKPTPGTYSQVASIDKYRNTIVSGDVNGGPVPVAFPAGTPGAISGTVNVVATPGATSFLQAEDSAIPDLQTGPVILGQRNDAAAIRTTTDGDAATISTNARGALAIDLDASFRGGGATSIIQVEDVALPDAKSGVVPLVKLQAALTVDAADGDAGAMKGDLAGRTITTLAPAGESWQSCGTATAVTTDVAIKASVASNRIYVTSINCKNTSTTVGPTIDFKDGTTIIAVGGITATSATGLLTSDLTKTFPVPLRGTSATAFNFATNTAVSSVTCCAQGYISVN